MPRHSLTSPVFHLVLLLALSIPRLALAQGAMANGQNHAGAIAAPGEIDEWTFTATQGDAIALSLAEVGPDTVFAPWLRLRAPDGTQLSSNTNILVAQINILAAPQSGSYTVLVSTSDTGNDATGDYVVTLAKTPGEFVVPVGDEGGPMINGANHSGTIHRGDLDQWTFTADQGDSIALSLGEVGPNGDFTPWLRLRAPNGTQLSTNTNILVAQINLLTAPQSGTYTVLVGTSDNGLDATGDYLLTVAKTPGTFVVPDGDEGGPMSNGTAFLGNLHVGDLDQWTFCAAASSAVSITMAEIGPDSELAPWIRLRAPDGAQLSSNTNILVAQINTTAPATGLYTVIAGTSDNGLDASGDYQLTVNGAIGCTPPTTVNDAYTTGVNAPLSIPAPGVLANDSSNGGGTMTATLVSTVSGGTLALNPNGSVTYTPPSGFTGVDSFTYRAVNAFGPGNTATVTLTVTHPPPTTVGDVYSTNAGTPLTVAAPGVLGNDVSNGAGALSAQLLTTAAHGVVSLNADGSLTYTPAAGYAGPDSFTYRAVSTAGPGNTATVALTIVDTTQPQPPTDLIAKSIVGNTVTLKWRPPASGATATDYVLEGGVNPGEVAASIPIGSRNPIYTFVAPTGAFHVRIHTVAGRARSAASNEIRIFVGQPATPSAPANLLGLVNGSSIALAWRNTYFGGAPSGVVLDVTGSLNASLPLALSDSFQFLGVPGGTYTLSVRAINAAGSSPSSNAITLSFPGPCSGAPLPPSGFLAYATGRTLTVVWDPATSGDAPTSYVLSVSGGFTGSFATLGRTLSGTVGAGTYHLRVGAVNACGASATTETQTVVVP
jgi:hypothetical protein